MVLDKSKVDLNRPAFGPNAQKVSELEEATPESQPETAKVEEPTIETEDSVEEPVEQHVPYSRLKRYRDEAVQLREEAEQARRDAEEWRRQAESRREPIVDSNEPDAAWLRMYGDNEASRDAWKIDQQRRNQWRDQIIEEARREALETLRSERREEEVRVQENLGTIDENLEQLNDYVGRQLTDREQSAILDIVDDYTPKNEDGTYAGPTIPFEKAWNIYEMQNRTQKSQTASKRDAVAAISGSESQGEPDKTEKDKSFIPGAWGSWRKRL